MKYYMELSQFNIFTIEDAMKIIGNLPATKKYIKSLIDTGLVHRIKRNLYTCVNVTNGDDVANRFQIGSNINDNSYISYHSAFEFYGFYNQVYYEVQVSSDKKFTPFEYNDYSYVNYLNNINCQIDLIQGTKVTSIERTLVDSIDMLGKVMDLEEFVKCLDLIHIVKESKLKEILDTYGKEVLYRKVGYILSFYKEEFDISDSFFDFCLKKGVNSNRGYLVNNFKEELTYNSFWGLYVYPDIRNIYNKGKS